MKQIKVTVRGIAPILQARHPSPEEEKDFLKRTAGSKQKTKDLTDKEQFELHSYKNRKGFFQPSEMIEAAMVKAATNFKLEGKKTYKDVVKGGLFVEPVEIVHENQKVSMDSRWGVNKNTRGAVWVVRPRFDDWALRFVINVTLDERIELKTLKDILEYAGLFVGIGAWRPKFGRFEVVEFKQVK